MTSPAMTRAIAVDNSKAVMILRTFICNGIDVQRIGAVFFGVGRQT
jgi:hypothetical protein